MKLKSSGQIKPFIIGWCIFLLLAMAMGTYFARNGDAESFDFRSLYAAGYQVRTNPSHLYDLAEQERVQESFAASKKGVLQFIHAPYESLVYAPFSLLKYRPAYLAFAIFNLLLLAGTFFVARPAFSRQIPWWQPRPGLMIFIFFPAMIAVIQGQDSILLLFLCALTWRMLSSGRDMSAGCMLALALFKFQIALPLAAILIAYRGRRFFAGFVAAAVGVALLCLGLIGKAGAASLMMLLIGATSGTRLGVTTGMRVYPTAMPNLEGLLYACGTRFLQPHAAFLVVAVCSSVVFLWCIRKALRADLNCAFAIAVLCALVVSYHLYIHDLTLALLPATLLNGKTQKYLLAGLFVPPVLLLNVGPNWFFVLVLPVLAMLVFASSTITNPSAAIPDTVQASIV